MAEVKSKQKVVNYLNKDFSGFRGELIEHAKTYFAGSYADFNEASPGMMFIEMASHVGDVLSFYMDEQFRESLLVYAEEKKTVYDIAQSYGYLPKTTTPSTVTLDFFQTVPAIGSGDNIVPDYRYGYRIKQGSIVGADKFGKSFRTLDEVNFQQSGSVDPVEVSIYEVDDDNKISKYLLKKKVRAVSGTIATEKFSFGAAKAYDKITLGNDKVIEVISCIDQENNKWYQVDSLAQDMIFDEVSNDAQFDQNLAAYNDTTPYILKLIRTQNRFKLRVTPGGFTELRFGSGIVSQADDEVIPNPSNVGTSFTNTNFLNTNSALDPANFMETGVYGKAPTNTTLTIKYTHGGGNEANVPANTITSKKQLNLEINSTGLDAALVESSRNSIAVNNPVAATGGAGEETIKELKENVKQYYYAQQRAVSKEDYITRVYNLPAKYGNVAKLYITQDDQLNSGQGVLQEQVVTQETLDEYGGQIKVSDLPVRVPNPMAMNFYVLGYNNNKKLVKVNPATKKNIKSYLGPYRILTDAINIKDAFIINIGVRFSIYAKKGYNKQEVLFKCIDKIKSYFEIDKWQINQPIILSDLAYEISLVDGVNNVVPPDDQPIVIDSNGMESEAKELVVISNKFKTVDGYSGNIYDISKATRQGVVYPSLDPAIFEIRNPNVDIVGKCLGDY
tara:strand:+ start:275 stop:2296 length:2022 start_codon:yes stop_codon:yes gene_type:complete